ncbi:hypothetical protein J4E08_19205 [Sagittula sp. NFXS13]|uniref:hypothetical protein n=1 Tax=Sagittula sp. NFXS13 TaxID=2819095 RepID=UPI0032DF33EF
MAIIAFMFSSILGTLVGVAAWAVASVPPMAAFGLYLSLSVVLGFAFLLYSWTLPPQMPGRENAAV